VAEDVSIRMKLQGQAQTSSGLRDVRGEVKDLGEATGKAARETDRGTKKMSASFSGLGDKLKGGAAAAGAAAAAGLAAGFNEALTQIGSKAKLAGQLGLSGPEAARAGKVAGDLYTSAYGASIEESNDAVRSVLQNMGGIRKLSTAQLKGYSADVLNIVSTFGSSADEVTRTAGALVANGMAPSFGSAMNLIVTGFQKGADKGGEFLDTLNEYAQPMKELGLSGRDFTNMLVAGAENGVYSVDKIGDAIKEFHIRATDGSVGTVAAFRALKLPAEQTAAAIAAGGPKARTAMSEVMTALQNVRSPLERERIGVALYGSMWEDIGGKAILGLNPAINKLGQTRGAANRLNTTLGDTSAAKVTAFARNMKQGVVDFLATEVIPAIEGAGKALDWLGEKLKGATGGGVSLGDVAKASFAPGRALVDAIRGRATGGVVRPGETTLVGERGPEIATFRAGTRIIPMPRVPSLPAAATGGGGGQRMNVTLVTHDGRVLADVVHQADARRGRRAP
jgi:hypothetical protein